jgi:hypothetical protein
MQKQFEIIHVGIAEALAEINRRNQSFLEAEARLAEKLKPARLTVLDLTGENGEWPPLPEVFPIK